MGINNLIPSLIFNSSSEEVNNNYTDMDPTIILRLHSILTGLDIFHLSEEFDYKVSEDSNNVYSLKIPNELVQELAKIDVNNIDDILYQWNKSQEVRLSAWSLPQTATNLCSLINQCRTSDRSITIKMHLNDKPLSYT